VNSVSAVNMHYYLCGWLQWAWVYPAQSFD